ncbi:MAG: hypothetical protein AAFZ49_15960 [Cyanobacteria bacterium J06659_2]
MKNVSPKSIDRRDRPIPVRLPIEVEIFYALTGDFVREGSTTRMLEQFLIDRSTIPDNIAALARGIEVRAKILGKAPRDVLIEALEEKGYGEFLDLDNTADALCLAYGLEQYQEPELS